MAEITDFGPRKTVFILAIVAGCFAVLWPKIFYPMLTASVNPHHTSDSSACCDVIFESDVTAADIMQEMCQNILKHHQVDPRVRDALKIIKLTPQSTSLCREEILARCGIDLSTFLADRERLGKSYKQVLEEIRSFNSSLCLKMHFGIPLSQLGTPHLIRYHILMPHSTIRQERRTPPHAGGLHPALRERGRAIPSSHIVPKVTDRPDHVVPKMRPPLGGAGHVVSAPKGNGTMGIIMPLYTLGIVLFFLYTIVKVLKKNSDNEIISEYPGVAAEKEFRKMVFSPEPFASAMSGGTACNLLYRKDRSQSPNRLSSTDKLKDQAAGDIKIDHLTRRLVETEAAMERIVVKIDNMSRSVMHPSSQQEFKEMRDTTCLTPIATSAGGLHDVRGASDEQARPIYLEGALPPQCELLVTDSETQAQKTEEDAEAPVVLSGKMTLSLISLDQTAAESEEENQEIRKVEDVTVLDTNDTEKSPKIGSLADIEHEETQVTCTVDDEENEDRLKDENGAKGVKHEMEDDEDEEDEIDEESGVEEEEEEVEEEEEEEEVEEEEEEEEEEDEDEGDDNDNDERKETVNLNYNHREEQENDAEKEVEGDEEYEEEYEAEVEYIEEEEVEDDEVDDDNDETEDGEDEEEKDADGDEKEELNESERSEEERGDEKVDKKEKGGRSL